MERNTIEKIFNFLKEKEGKQIPSKWFDLMKKLKLIKELENYTDGVQYKHKGNLTLSYTRITKLPNDLYVDGSLFLWDCAKLTKLPDNLYVGKNLDLWGCEQLTKLPDNLYVGQSLIMIGTSIEEIPDNLYVNGDIYIYDTPLAKKYTDKEIYRLVASTGGELIGKIFR